MAQPFIPRCMMRSDQTPNRSSATAAVEAANQQTQVCNTLNTNRRHHRHRRPSLHELRAGGMPKSHVQLCVPSFFQINAPLPPHKPVSAGSPLHQSFCWCYPRSAPPKTSFLRVSPRLSPPTDVSIRVAAGWGDGGNGSEGQIMRVLSLL